MDIFKNNKINQNIYKTIAKFHIILTIIDTYIYPILILEIPLISMSLLDSDKTVYH